MFVPDQHNRPSRRDSLVAALLDVKFERRVTPVLVRWVYVLALGVIGFGTLFGLLWVWWFASWMGGWAWWLAAPIVVGLGLVALLVVRIICERIIFRTQPQPPPVPPGYRHPVQSPGVRQP